MFSSLCCQISLKQHVSVTAFVIVCLVSGATKAADIEITMTVIAPIGAPTSYSVTGPQDMTVEQAIQRAKIKYTAAWYPNPPGYAVLSINGFPPIITAELSRPFWWLCINDKSAQEGISSLKISDHDKIDWRYSMDGHCPSD